MDYDKNKTLISPLSHKSVTGNYLNVVQATPTAYVQLDSLTTHLLKQFPEDEIVVMGYGEEDELVETHQRFIESTNSVTKMQSSIS